MAEHLHITPIGNDGLYILDTASWRVFRPVMNKEKCVSEHAELSCLMVPTCILGS